MTQQDLNAFADWLVANQSKKGTPEYDTVAKAFSELDTQNQDTSLSTAYQFGDKMVQANSADYTADLNQRMDDGFLGDMTRMGQKYIGNPIRNALGFDDIQQDKANRDFEAANRAKATQLRGEADALNYRSLTADDIDGVGSAINYGAQAVAESLPQMLPALANPTVGGALNMGIIMPGELNAELKEIEGLDDNTRMNLAASGGALMGALETLGVGILFKGVPTEVLGKMGVKRIAAALEKKGMGRVANRFVSGFAGEGVTEVGQNEISMAFEGLGGKDINDEEAYLRRRESFLKGGAAGGMIRGGGSAVVETASGIKNAATSPEIADDPEAASELANDLNRVANVDGYDLQNVNTGATTGARAAVDTLHAEYSSQIEFEFSELESKLGITKEDPRYEAFQKVKANTAKRKGKNKVKSRVDPSDFAILRDLTQGTEEGANLLKLLRKSNELSFLANQGLKGGLSQYFDVLNPLDTDGRYNIGRTVAAPISTLGAYGTYGASVLPAVAGRAVDAMTGRRSRVARYVRENQGNPGIQVPTEPSLRDQDQEATANAERDALRVNNEERQTAEFLDSIDAPPAANPNNPSPQAQLEDATGFDKQTAIDVAAMIGNSNFYPEAIRRFATDYIASVRQGGSVGKNGEGGLSSLIRVMNRLADSDPDNYPRANPQNQLAIQAAGGGGPTIMTRAAMQREQGRADNQAFNKELQAAVNADTSIDPQTKALVLEGLNKALKTFAGNPVEAVEAIYLDVATRAKNPQYADQYIMPYVERVTAQQQQQAATEQPAATEAPSSPGPIYRNAPIFRNQGPVLSLAPGTPLSTDTTARTGTAYGLLPYLRTVSGKTYDHPRKILAASNPKNAQQQIDNLDGLLIDHPNTLASPEAFTDYLSDAMGKANKDGSVPLIPYRALQMIQDPSIIEDQLLNLSEGQKSLAAEGFAAADSFKQAYAEGAATPAITGKLLLWGILSRGVSPFIQEGLFLDVVVGEGKTNIAPWIEAAAEGKFDVNAYLEWVKETVPEYSPGRGTTSNLNSFGKDLLRKMSVKDENGLTSMQKLHDLIANPELSGKDIRREFHKLNDKVGINNKVLSFILLVTGRQDVFVLDRVQMRNLFDDGTFGDFNLYDASKNEEGKAITGSSMAPLGDDIMGLLYYEALERDLAPVIKQVYEKLGRGNDFSIGRYHWESWVSQSFQEVDHGTIAGLLNESLGLENPFSGITTKEGRYNRFDSGAIYGYDDNLNQYVILPDGLGNSFKLTPEGANNVLKRVRLKSVKNVIVPKNFQVSESKDKPYYEQPEINREALSSLLQEEGGQLVTTGVPETGEGNSNVARSGSRPEGVTYNRGPDIPPPGTNNGRRSEPRTIYQTSIAGSRPATPTESKAQQEPVKALFEIGKKGSPYEFGIKDMAEARKLAKALFHSLTLYKDKKSFEEALGGPAGSTRAFRIPDADGPGQGGQIAVLDTGDALQNLFLALHEVGHPLEADYSPAYARSEPMVERNYYTSPNDGLERRGEIDTSDGLGGGFKTYRGTIRDFVATLQDGAAAFRSGRIKDKDTKQADAIIEEITNFQRFYKVGGTVPVREGYREAQQAVSEGALTLSEAQDSITDYENEYLHMPYEMAADVIAAYLFDPRMAKREMPKTTAVLQVLFEGNPTVQLFSLPFASVLAVIMANMLIAEREEEEKKMPPLGALSLGQAPGALSI